MLEISHEKATHNQQATTTKKTPQNAEKRAKRGR